MRTTCSLDDAARDIGVSPNQVLQIIHTHPDIFPGIDIRIKASDIFVPKSCLTAFKSLYKGAYTFVEIAERLGVSIKRLQKVKTTPGTCLLARSFCAVKTCPQSGRPLVRRQFPRQDAEAFIEYCETRSIFKLMQPNVKISDVTYDTLKPENITCASKAYRYQDAVQDGLTPQNYTSSDILPGEYMGKLVFKVWGGKSIIHCFFILENNASIRLTTFRPHATPWRGYTPKDGRVDFSQAGIEGTRYKLRTGVTPRGTVSFLSATVI